MRTNAFHTDFGEALTEQVNRQHEWVIDDAPACLIVVDGENRIAKKVWIEEHQIDTHWCPKTYAYLIPDPRPPLFSEERARQ